jgi:uncharacterized protein GlcG (DUF336 family)|tara:strand:+ start:8202 stop:8720 length:519 start_codon:yes stop_codon:yes gene_type:complete
MRLVTSLLALLPLAFAQTNTTNGIGSTPSQRYVVSSTQAQSIINAAVINATALNIPQNIAVVNPSGLLVAFLAMDNAYLGSIDISQKKARTAVLFNGIPSAGLYAGAQPGQSVYGIEETNGGLVVFGGGFPIYVDGKLIGGVGVSGGSVEQDVLVATAGVLGLSGASPNQPS